MSEDRVREEVANILLDHIHSNRFPDILRAGLPPEETEILVASWAYDIARDILSIPVKGATVDGSPKPVVLGDLLL